MQGCDLTTMSPSDTIINNHLSDDQIRSTLKLHRAQKGIEYRKMGEGKSRIALALYQHLQPEPPSICLVVCRRKAFDTWRDEIRKVNFKVYVNEFPNLKEPAVSTIRPTLWLLSHAMLSKVYLKLYQYPISVIIYDELYLYSNPRSKLTRSAVSLSCAMAPPARVYGLSGTIMAAGDALGIYSQSQVVGIEQHIARNITDFHTRYQTSFDLNFGQGTFKKFKNRPDAFKRIRKAILPWCNFYFPKGKRRSVDHDVSCPLSAQQTKYIQQLKKDYYLEVEDAAMEMELRSTLELVHRVSQISNGYLPTADGSLVTFHSPKTEAVENRVEEILGVGSRCVVWCYFASDIDYLKGIFKNIPTLQMSGRHQFDRHAWTKHRASVVLATVGTGSSINDFAQVEYGLYFSHSYKFLELEQSRARTARRDSLHDTSYYYHFTSIRTFDQAILRAARQSEKTQNEFIMTCQNILQSI